MNKKHLLILVCLFALLVGAFSAGAQDAKILNIHLQQEADTMNPMYTGMWFAAIIHDLIYSPAWFIDNNQVAVPVLVTEIPSFENGGISEDGTVITLNLRDDIVWSDGEPITSADFVFTYNMIIDEGNTPQGRYPWDERSPA
jgi:peptide/nickel transport system substrate-binding protein